MPFEPTDLHSAGTSSALRDTTSDASKWTPILSQACDFNVEIFKRVMTNLIWNPNINSSFVFRADCIYDDGSSEAELSGSRDGSLSPWRTSIEGFVAERTIVRKMIPRNPQRDASLLQTCCMLEPVDGSESSLLVLYLPHADSPEEIPFYHPKIAGLAYLFKDGNISIHFKLFSASVEPTVSERLVRVATSLLATVYKHGQGALAGYQKRVHHDVIVPQAKLQDTYTRLKAKHAKTLIDSWVEVTDPAKHVFEDLCIAAFLMELWAKMYGPSEFPGFVDIGAGNGLLVHILISEGYKGWGFDARRRKSWAIYPAQVQENLKELILVPKPLLPTDGQESELTGIHDGMFPSGTFIISNHADELTVWTPLLAYLSQCPFLCIPCCSHSLRGAKFRAPISAKAREENSVTKNKGNRTTQSVYASLCDYTENLGENLGLEMEREMLRIPSTRNVGLLCRTLEAQADKGSLDERIQIVNALVQKEGGGGGWVSHCFALRTKKEGH